MRRFCNTAKTQVPAASSSSSMLYILKAHPKKERYITSKRICIIAQALQHCNVPQVNLVSPSKSTSGCRFCNTTRRMHEHIELHVKVLKHCIRFVYFLHLGGLKRCDTFTFGSQTLGSGGFGAVADGKRTSPRAGHLTFFASSHDTHKHFMSVSLTLIEAAPIVLALLLTRS